MSAFDPKRTLFDLDQNEMRGVLFLCVQCSVLGEKRTVNDLKRSAMRRRLCPDLAEATRRIGNLGIDKLRSGHFGHCRWEAWRRV
jgi:hypothetical protein